MTIVLRPYRETLRDQILQYEERGRACTLWGVDASDMSREELLGFIGFLDEVVTDRAGLGKTDE